MTGAVTVIVPTRDESLHIERCIHSAKALGPVWVVDSLSEDDTVPMAERAGAQVVQQAWLGHAAQKNWALDNVPIRTKWVLFLDADEYLTPKLIHEIGEVVEETNRVAWYVPRRNIFMGRELRHAWWYPDYQLRLFVFGSARYEDREVHEHMVTDGPTGYMSEAIVHESLKGTAAFLERHARYARAEADAIRTSPRSPLRALKTRAGRRRFVKTQLWYRMPFRPGIRLLWLYVVRRGFLDGREGLVYCQLIAAYEAMIDAYLLEGSRRPRRKRIGYSTGETQVPASPQRQRRESATTADMPRGRMRGPGG